MFALALICVVTLGPGNHEFRAGATGPRGTVPSDEPGADLKGLSLEKKAQALTARHHVPNGPLPDDPEAPTGARAVRLLTHDPLVGGTFSYTLVNLESPLSRSSFSVAWSGSVVVGAAAEFVLPAPKQLVDQILLINELRFSLKLPYSSGVVPAEVWIPDSRELILQPNYGLDRLDPAGARLEYRLSLMGTDGVSARMTADYSQGESGWIIESRSSPIEFSLQFDIWTSDWRPIPESGSLDPVVLQFKPGAFVRLAHTRVATSLGWIGYPPKIIDGRGVNQHYVWRKDPDGLLIGLTGDEGGSPLFALVPGHSAESFPLEAMASIELAKTVRVPK